MTNYQPPADDRELLKYMAELFSEMDAASPEELDNFLRELGFGPDQIAAQAQEIIEQALRQSPQDWRNRAPGEVEEERQRLAQASSERPFPQDRTEILTAIQEFARRLGINANQKMVSTYHRNLDSASDQDLLSLLADLQYLASQRKLGLEDHTDQER